jgi:predicted transcriptional regulator
MKTFEKVFIVPDFMITMVAIDDNPNSAITEIHYKSKITYSHLHFIVKFLEHKGWIYIVEDKRRHIPNLTEKGREIIKNIYQLLDSMGITKQDVYNYKLKEKVHNKEMVISDKVPVVNSFAGVGLE